MACQTAAGRHSAGGGKAGRYNQQQSSTTHYHPNSLLRENKPLTNLHKYEKLHQLGLSAFMPKKTLLCWKLSRGPGVTGSEMQTATNIYKSTVGYTAAALLLCSLSQNQAPYRDQGRPPWYGNLWCIKWEMNRVTIWLLDHSCACTFKEIIF